MLFMKSNQYVLILGAIFILSTFTACQKAPAANSAVSETVMDVDTSKAALSGNAKSLNATEFRGKSYSFYYDTEKWVDSTDLKEQLDGSSSASSTDVILEAKNSEGNFIMVTDTDVGKKGEFEADELGAQYEAAASADDKIRYLGCKDIEINGHKGICVTLQISEDNMMEMWYFWHGTHQTLFALNTSKDAFEELYQDFMQVINSVELD